MSLPQAFPAEEVTLSMMIIILIMILILIIGMMIIMLILMIRISLMRIKTNLPEEEHDIYNDCDKLVRSD